MSHIMLNFINGVISIPHYFVLQQPVNRFSFVSGSEKVSAPVNHTVWTTALVLCYLKLTFPDRSDEWSLFSRKARTWLEAQAMNFTDDAKSAVSYCDALMQKALLTIHPE